MQSESRIALPYLPARAAFTAVLPSQKRSRSVSLLRTMLPDLLLGWDMAAVFVSGVALATLPLAFVANQTAFDAVNGHVHPDLIQASASAALLCPLLVRDRRLGRVDLAMIKSLTPRLGLLIALAMLLIGATHPASTMPLRWAAAWFGSVLSLQVAGRLLASAVIGCAARHFGGERVAVIGVGNEADWLRGALRQAKGVGIELVTPGRRNHNLDAAIAELLEQGRRGMLDRVILAQPGLSNKRVRHIAHRLKALQIEVASLFPLLGAGSPRPGINLADIPLFLIARRPQWGYGGLTKQVMDCCLALALLIWLAPLLLLIGMAIGLDSPGPILFRQRRHGVNGGEFDIYKFRTMIWQDRVAGAGAQQTSRRDRRITRVGSFLRKSSLDEVPQLLNVLNGTMSLVGPRPHPTVMRTEDRSGDEIVAEYPHRQRVKPGITGWAQVNGLRGATETADQLRRRIEHDNFYIENWSPWFDLRILVMTPVSLLLRRHNAY